MKTATGLILIAIGAILGLALNVRTHDVNWHIIGLIIALTGAAGLLLDSRNTGWLRRRFLVTRNPAPEEEAPAPGHQGHQGGQGRQGAQGESAYVVDDPAALAAEIINRAQRGGNAPAAGGGQQPARPQPHPQDEDAPR